MIARFRLLSPLSHGAFGADAGNALPLRRLPVVSLPDRPRVPAVSGNALRGLLRRYLMRELFWALGIGPEASIAWDRIYAALANGGTIEKAEKRLDPGRIREIREAVPALSALGSAMYTWHLTGHCRIGFCWPVCQETVAGGLVPPVEGEVPTAGEIESEYTETRLPDVTEHDPAETKVGPMPTTIEVLSTGTELVSEIGFARHAPAVERSAIAHGLTLLDHLGGKAAHGLGRFVPVLEGEDADPEPYREWGQETANLDRAREAILNLPETW